MLITLVCITCEHQPSNGDFPDDWEYLKTEIWNGLEFRQRKGVTDNQYEIALNKFKKVFNSDSFTDNQRERIKNKINIVTITDLNTVTHWDKIGDGITDYFLLYLPYDVIQDDIEKAFKNILLS